MLDARPGDMIVLFYEEFENAIQMITKFKKEQEETNLIIETSFKSTRVDLKDISDSPLSQPFE